MKKPKQPVAPTLTERTRVMTFTHDFAQWGSVKVLLEELAEHGITDLSKVSLYIGGDEFGDYILKWDEKRLVTATDEEWAVISKQNDSKMESYRALSANYEKDTLAFEAYQIQRQAQLAAEARARDIERLNELRARYPNA